MNILFDLDGTLTDPREGIVACLKYALGGLSRQSPPDVELERYIGPPLYESFGTLLCSTDRKEIDAAIALYRERFSTQGIFENAVYPGIEAALEQLQILGTTLYVVTSKPHLFADRIVEHFGLGRYFQGVYGSELDGTRTKKADLIAHVLKTESISPRSTFMVGDRAHDVLGATAHDVFPIGALWGYGSREELAAAGAMVFCEKPTLLRELLSSLPGGGGS